MLDIKLIHKISSDAHLKCKKYVVNAVSLEGTWVEGVLYSTQGSEHNPSPCDILQPLKGCSWLESHCSEPLKLNVSGKQFTQIFISKIVKERDFATSEMT